MSKGEIHFQISIIISYSIESEELVLLFSRTIIDKSMDIIHKLNIRMHKMESDGFRGTTIHSCLYERIEYSIPILNQCCSAIAVVSGSISIGESWGKSVKALSENANE